MSLHTYFYDHINLSKHIVWEVPFFSNGWISYILNFKLWILYHKLAWILGVETQLCRRRNLALQTTHLPGRLSVGKQLRPASWVSGSWRSGGWWRMRGRAYLRVIQGNRPLHWWGMSLTADNVGWGCLTLYFGSRVLLADSTTLSSPEITDIFISHYCCCRYHEVLCSHYLKIKVV